MLLLCAGAVASLAGVWTLAGLSESSPLRITPRVAFAALTGLGGAAMLYTRAPVALRSALVLPMLFGTASLLALVVGAAKLDAALVDKDGQRAVRRAAGLVVGAALGMAAVGAASLDLSSNSLVHARFGWGFMFAFIASVLVVFAGRARYAGAGFVALGQRAFVLALVAVALLVGARLTVAIPSRPVAVTPAAPEGAAQAVDAPAADRAVAAPPTDAGSALPSEMPAVPAAAASASAEGASSAQPLASTAAEPPGAPQGPAGQVEVGAIAVRGLLEADARGGVEHRKDRLQACLVDPKNAQRGSLTFKVGIDPSGSVAYVRPTEGDLKGTPLADCFLRVFYKMGFAAPSSDSANFHVTLSVP